MDVCQCREINLYIAIKVQRPLYLLVRSLMTTFFQHKTIDKDILLSYSCTIRVQSIRDIQRRSSSRMESDGV